MSGYTKGPWVASAMDNGLEWEIKDTHMDEYDICECFGSPGFDVRGGDATAEANAHLVAAAPDLYEALKELIARHDELVIALHTFDGELSCSLSDHDVTVARASLTKAEGK